MDPPIEHRILGKISQQAKRAISYRRCRLQSQPWKDGDSFILNIRIKLLCSPSHIRSPCFPDNRIWIEGECSSLCNEGRGTKGEGEKQEKEGKKKDKGKRRQASSN